MRAGEGRTRWSPQPNPGLEFSGCGERVVAGNHPFLGVALLSNERIVRAVLLTPDNTPASVRALLYLGAIFGKPQNLFSTRESSKKIARLITYQRLPRRLLEGSRDAATLRLTSELCLL